jgi:glycolate oxidase FAD binding subunit
MADVGLGEIEVADQDGHLWERQRAGQRSTENALVKVSAAPAELATILAAAEACAGRLVGRAALGTSFIEVEPAAVSRLRGLVPAGASTVILDAPASLRAQADPWGVNAERQGGALALMRRIKERFDPAGTCNPGLFVGGI